MATNKQIDRLAQESAAGTTIISPSNGEMATHYAAFMHYDPVNQVEYCETWQAMDDTHLALEYSLTATADVSTTPGKLTLTTSGAGTDTAGLKTLGKSVLRAMVPVIETTVTLGQLTATNFDFGLYDDADELCLVRYDSADATTSSTNWVIEVGNGTSVVALDTGIAATTSATTIRIAVDSTGKPYVWIDETYIPWTSTHVISGDGHYIYSLLTESAAAAKTAVLNYLTFRKNKK